MDKMQMWGLLSDGVTEVPLAVDSSGRVTMKLSGAEEQIGMIGSNLKSVSAAFAKSSGTTAYAVGDVVGPGSGAAVQSFDIGRIAEGDGFIVKARLVKGGAVVTNAVFRMYLFNAAPTAIADNSPFTLLWADRAKYIGAIDFVLSTEGTGSDSAQQTDGTIRLPYELAAASTTIYGVLVARAAYTPVTIEDFWIELTAERN